MSLLDKISKLSTPETIVKEAQRANPFSGSGIPAHLTVTYHGECGRRISLGRKLFESIGKPNDIEISFQDNFLIIRDGGGSGYKLSKVSTGKPILYNSAVTKRIVDYFNIDLSEHTTHSFYNGESFNGAFYIEMIPDATEFPVEETVEKAEETAEDDIFLAEEAEWEDEATCSEKEPDVLNSAAEEEEEESVSAEEEDDLFFEEEE